MKQVLLLCILCVLPLVFVEWGGNVASSQEEPLLKRAGQYYAEAESTTSLSERHQKFNQALDLYKQLEKKYYPVYGNGRLYYDIANSYFQLGEYPWAALYYYRAAALMPYSEKLQWNQGQNRRLLEGVEEARVPWYDLMKQLNQVVPLPLRLQLISLFTWGSFLFASFAFWNRKRWQVRGAVVCLIAVCLLLLTVAYSWYAAPVEAVVVRSSILYRDAGAHYSEVSPHPLTAGVKVLILDIVADGEWIQVRGPDGQIGYLSFEGIRII